MYYIAKKDEKEPQERPIVKCPNCGWDGAIDCQDVEINQMHCPQCGHVWVVPDDRPIVKPLDAALKDLSRQVLRPIKKQPPSCYGDESLCKIMEDQDRPIKKQCSWCNGKGVVPADCFNVENCPVCQGAGFKIVRR